MLNQIQKENIINLLKNNTTNAVAYYVRMTSLNQKSRIAPETFEICKDIISEFYNKHIDPYSNNEELVEDKSFKTAVKNATAELIGEKEISKFSSVVDGILKKFSKEKKPNTGWDGLHKECFNNIGQIYTRHYSKSPKVVAEYTKIAKNDFPGLQDRDIEVVVFGGNNKKGTMAIRFRIPKNSKRPGDYMEWNDPYGLDELVY